MRASERQSAILDILSRQRRVSVQELTSLVQASEATVRRDLERMERMGRLRRVFGGAEEVDPVGFEPPYLERLNQCSEEKRAIARVAARLVPAGAIVALDTGSTTTQVAQELRLRQSPFTVVTPSLIVGQLFADSGREDVVVILPGGLLRNKTYSLVGPTCEQTIRTYRCDVAVMACHALLPDQGAMNTNLLALGTKQAMVEISSKVIVVADHTKFSANGLATFAAPSQIDVIVTDHYAPAPVLERFREQGIEVIVTSPSVLLQ